jgi:putative transposase
MGLVSRDDGWRMPGWLWERIEPLLPPPPFILRAATARGFETVTQWTRSRWCYARAMQWKALDLTGPCSSSSAHRRFQEWERVGVFHEIWRRGLLEYDELVGIDWGWLAADGATTKARWAGQDQPQSHRQNEKGAKRSVFMEAAWVPVGLPHEGANRHDQSSSSRPSRRYRSSARSRPPPPLPRSSLRRPGIHELAHGHGFRPHIRARGGEIDVKLRTPGWQARGWVAEAAHSWLNRNRAILIRWSKKGQNHLAPLQLASGLIAYKKAHARLAAQPG